MHPSVRKISYPGIQYSKASLLPYKLIRAALLEFPAARRRRLKAEWGLTRWKRMQGYSALWLPGSDHASIATEVKVVDRLRKEEGKEKEDIGRDGFLDRAWAWKNEYGNRITKQCRKLGDSCDWSREHFTMDEGCNKAVFIRRSIVYYKP